MAQILTTVVSVSTNELTDAIRSLPEMDHYGPNGMPEVYPALIDVHQDSSGQFFFTFQWAKAK